MREVGYIYEAAFHCRDCAKLRFGAKLERGAVDREGNPVGVLFACEASPDGEYCDTCFEEIAAPAWA